MNNSVKNLIKIIIVLLISGSMFLVPFEALGLPLNAIQVRVVALFVMAALMWILEPIPIWTTSVLVITISLLCMSNQSLSFMKPVRYDKTELNAIIVAAAAGPQANARSVADLVVAANDPKPSSPEKAEKFISSVMTMLTPKNGVNAEAFSREVMNDITAAQKTADEVKAIEELKSKAEEKKAETGSENINALSNTIDEQINNVSKDSELGLAVHDIISKIHDRLNKKPNLNADEVRMTLGYQMMDASEKAALAGKASLADDLQKAVDELYHPVIAKQIKKMSFVNTMQQKSTMATFADPIIILFLGGFFLAAAATKYRLDINLAKVLLKPFGTNPKYVMLGLMVVTALFSMFMSNTATAAMMLAILAPVLSLFGPNDRGRAAFALCIPIAANIGGIGTPIGTPPNAIALKQMEDMGLTISFGKWMLFGVPFVIIMLLIAWLLLIKLFPIQQKELKLEVGGKFLKTPKAIIVYVTFIITVLLWVTGKSVHGLDSNTVAIIPIAVFAVTQVITKDDLRQMSWDVLWLVAGGFALGLALQETSLAKDMINAIPFGSWSSTLLMIGAGSICLFMATFMSHTATASLLMPILASVAGAMVGSGSMDSAGAIGLLCAIAFASSLGMALPISTPPNALAYATGLVESKGMAITGTILCLLGLVFTFGLMSLLMSIGFFY